MHKNMFAFACIHAKAWHSMFWTLSPKDECIIQKDWRRVVLCITSGYMVPIANYIDLSYGSKLTMHQEIWVPQKDDKENQCAQQPGHIALAGRQALRTVLSGESLSWRENIYFHVDFRYEGEIGGKKPPLRGYMQEKNTVMNCLSEVNHSGYVPKWSL